MSFLFPVLLLHNVAFWHNCVWWWYFKNFYLSCKWLNNVYSHSALICTLISENQGLEKSMSSSNLSKNSVPANLNFFSRSPSRKKKLGLYHKPEKIQVTNFKKIQVCMTWNLSEVWNRPWFLKKSRCRLNGWLSSDKIYENAPMCTLWSCNRSSTAISLSLTINPKSWTCFWAF